MIGSLRGRLPLLLVLLGGTAVRLFRLGADSLWYDETVSTYLAGSPLPELLRHTAGDIHPPLYYALLRGWLVVLGYPMGRADPAGIGLEFSAGFLSLGFGVLLIVLAYILAQRIAGRHVALIAAALVALSPYHVWYSQEVRMYTLGAVLGTVTLYVLLRGTHGEHRWPAAVCQTRSTADADGSRPAAESSAQPIARHRPSPWWLAYALAAAGGMYTLYYFAFLLIPLNLWAVARLMRSAPGDERQEAEDKNQRMSKLSGPDDTRHHGLHLTFYASRLAPWLLANLFALFLYLPWLPTALRQATDPPVPPWRTTPVLLSALVESWQALSLGQSAPPWAWPVLVLTLGTYGLGLFALHSRRRSAEAVLLLVATLGPLALILAISLAMPLYHVRYLFTYSLAFYVVVAAGLARLWSGAKWVAALVGACWLVAVGFTLHTFWFEPAYRADDHRAATRFLHSRWRPGDVVLINAGYAYPPLFTYWPGTIAARVRLTEPLPAPRDDDALLIVATGHIVGDGGLSAAQAAGLGWGDPRSDFFALPDNKAIEGVQDLFQTFERVWHYRIYDTVNDPRGMIRTQLETQGQLYDDQSFAGEANMRVQGFVARAGARWMADLPTYRYAAGVSVQFAPLLARLTADETLYGSLTWRADASQPADLATSLRLVGEDGETWAQPPDERPLGPLFPSSRWPAGVAQRQPFSMPIPAGTPPGNYLLILLVYDPATGRPWPPEGEVVQMPPAREGLIVGQVQIGQAAATARPALARFGPLALVEAGSPATVIAAGGAIPVELLWQASEPPGEPLVVVVQLLDAGSAVVANLEEQPLRGRYPTQGWIADELVRDRHALQVPSGLAAGIYRLVVGVYRAADRQRLTTPIGLWRRSDIWEIKPIEVR